MRKVTLGATLFIAFSYRRCECSRNSPWCSGGCCGRRSGGLAQSVPSWAVPWERLRARSMEFWEFNRLLLQVRPRPQVLAAHLPDQQILRERSKGQTHRRRMLQPRLRPGFLFPRLSHDVTSHGVGTAGWIRKSLRGTTSAPAADVVGAFVWS
jgi:hypothetical protein